jgi:hypothetical protein
MNKKIHILIECIIVILILVGCRKVTPTNTQQQNGQLKNEIPTTNTEVTKSPEVAIPTAAISTSETIDYNQYVKKTWIYSKDKSQENGISFTISSIQNNIITGELTVVGTEPSCPNTVADFSGTINKDTADCQFTDSRENEGNIKLVFKPNDTIAATLNLTKKSIDDIAQPPEGTFQFTPLNINNDKYFSPIEDQSFMVDLDSWGNVKFVSGKYTAPDYIPVGFYLTDKEGDILYNFDPTFTCNADIKAVSFKDVNKDGLKDIIIIAFDSDNSDDMTTIYLQQPDDTFSNDPNLDQELNESGNNKDVKSVTDYLSKIF